jgi:hypothetical protein
MNNEWSKPRRTCYWSMDQHSQSPPRDGANVQPIDTHCSHDYCRSGPPKRNAGSRGPSVYPNASCSAWPAAVRKSVRADCAGVAMMPHHRRPGCDQEKWLITLCPACHATVERLERLDRYLPPLLLALWREQHPDAGEQLALELAASWEATTGDPSKQPDRKSRRDERRNSTTRSRCQFS